MEVKRYAVEGLVIVFSILLGLVVLALTLLMVYVRWFAKKVGVDLPYVEVHTLPETEKGVTRVRVCLKATARDFQLIRFYAEHADVERLGIMMPRGLVPEEDHEDVETIESWVPVKPLKLKPDQPIELEFRYDVSGGAPASVRGWAEAGLGLGGTIVPFTVVVGERDPLEIELSNRRSRLYAKAREEGVTPKEVPEFQEVQKLEAELHERNATRTRCDPDRSGSPTNCLQELQ